MMRSWLSEFTRLMERNGRALFFLLAAFVLAAFVLVPATYLVFRSVGGQTGIFGPDPFNGQTQQDGQDAGGQPDGLPPPPSAIDLPDPWDGSSRVTMLIMGLDYRDWSAGEGPSRTDTMILLTIDPATKTGGILSIPRDLWVNIPGFDPGKINTAYFLGEAYRVPGGGPALAMQTVEHTLGVPIDYYAQIDFQAFIDFVDRVGGVKINVPEAITIDPIGINTPRKNLKPGIQTLDGTLALAYARSRSTSGGDFSRAARQQIVIDALRRRVVEYNLLPDLIEDAPTIYNDLIGGINTNLPLEDAIQLAVLAFQIDPVDITYGIIDESYITYGTSPDELAILIPIPDKIRALRDEIFAGTGAISPATPGTSTERMQLEFARISVLDGTGSTSLGDRTADYLNGMGAQVVNVGVAEKAYFSTTVIDYSGRPFTLQFLLEIFGLQSANIIHAYDPNSAVDIEIKLGSDWSNSNPMP